MRTWNVAKGHGTENDFVILLDRHGMASPSPTDVRLLCDRRTGLGGDGLLRVVSAGQIPEWAGDPKVWFMDYRNADGSVSEMCGNGVRVFARYLVEEGLANGPDIPVGTRAGLKRVTMQRDGQVRVDMGQVLVDDEPTQVSLGGVTMTATKVDVGNPHAVAFVEDVAPLDLTRAPEFDAERYPDGVNVEFVEVVAPGHVRMRVFERGVGETRSCGTGTVAVAAAARRAFGGDDWRVDVPGGTLHIEVESTPDGGIERALMTGPAVVHIRGDVQVLDEQ
ncbi:diaminopimelate epimerase [Granulicoccus sp. GXG6511]|uniref:diaminopimelate epimerase n=1 Tax=Granulicoccus sp. GXG6511 TaxID=3381351 RepID=UPI003D7EF075